MPSAAIVLDGRGRLLPSESDGPARIAFGETDFTLAVGAESRVAAYRDLATIAIQGGASLLVLGSDSGAERFLLSRFGQRQGQLVQELRDRRLRQRLGDALIQRPADAIELVEYASSDEHGVAQLAYHPWGAVLAPLDERLDWIQIRRGAIERVDVDPKDGRVAVAVPNGGNGDASITLLGMGERAQIHGDRLMELSRAAHEDAGRLVGLLMPDAAYGARQEAARALVDGRPARPADLPAAWEPVEAAVLVEPTFAASYGALRDRAGGLAPERAIAMAPMEPGGDEAKTWFFVPLPGNLLALELVSEGAHATYCFRVQPRTEYGGGPTGVAACLAAVREISEALVDSRFLREPMALPEDQLRQPKYLRYRLALQVLPSLAAARRRFVARIVHRDDSTWAAAVDDLVRWHTAARDDAAVWPGRSAQEARVSEAAAGDGAAADESADSFDAAAVSEPSPEPTTAGAS